MIIISEKNEEIVLICLNCGATARFSCEECEKPLCGRCISREKKDLVSKVVLPAGLCNSCSKKRGEKFSTGEINTLSESISRYVNPILSGPKRDEKIQ
ncbi:MAG: hypothetical protein GOP50_08880 [Candidatus Heimdallarchaeota archaeon]|nr:hypothetical protein [Candidatus Heimdallarchaeota archaeon]